MVLWAKAKDLHTHCSQRIFRLPSAVVGFHEVGHSHPDVIESGTLAFSLEKTTRDGYELTWTFLACFWDDVCGNERL